MKNLKKAFLLPVFLSLLILFLSADDRRTDRTVLVIITLNCEFLWDGVAPEEGQVDFAWKGSKSEAEEHMQNVAEIIAKANPDIINLVEIENETALNTFNTKFLAGRGYVPYFIQGKDTYTGEDVALLSRIDPEGSKIWRDDRKGQSGAVYKSVSKNYYAKFTLGDLQFTLIGVHFLAIPLQQSRVLEREAQARAIRAVALERKAEGYSVIILGDFNDYDGESTCLDHVGSMPVSNVLKIAKEMDASDGSDDLVNATSYIQRESRYTAFWDANQNGEIEPQTDYTSIDHILLSPALASRVESVEIPHNHDPRIATDHFPVVVRLRTTDGGGQPSAPSLIRIKSLLPNPEGDEDLNEEAVIKNLGLQPVNLTGWKLRDLAGKTWSLNELGSLDRGQEKTIKRKGQSMALNNRGDTIALVDPFGQIIHSVTYASAEEGEVIECIIN